MKQNLVPVVAFALVLANAVILIAVITLRPWGSADRGYDTHLNIRDEAPQNYSRTNITLVDTEPGAPQGWVLAAGVTGIGEGSRLFIARGCASCHGLTGKGTAAGPSLLGSSERRTTSRTRKRPARNPYHRYHEGYWLAGYGE